MVVDSDFSTWVGARCAALECYFDRHLPSATLAPVRLHQAMRYVVLDGGKRLRALLVSAAGELVGAAAAALLPVAASVELIHAYSLVHDDLPCMDDDVLRRGKPTCHVQYDEPVALLVGDTLQSLAFQWLAQPIPSLTPVTQLELIRMLALASGSRGMGGGQAMDLESSRRQLTLEELEIIHLKKTGALIRAAILMGARCGTASTAQQTNALAHFANRMGLAFQVVDDILDATASTAILGKTAGKDAAANKPTYASLLGCARARSYVHELLEEALEALATLKADSLALEQLAHWVADRSH